MESARALHKHIFSLPAERFQGQPLELVREIEHFADTQRLPMVFRSEKMALARGALAGMAPAPRVLVEFGTFVGCSALGWGAQLRELNGGNVEGVHVYGFELDPELAGVARDMVKLTGLDDVVTVLDGPGADSLRRLVAEGRVAPRGVDVVFIDHWEKLYVPDLKVCEELGVLREGSLILADNTDMPGAPDYLEYVKGGGSGQPGAPRYESKTLTTPDDVATPHGRPRPVSRPSTPL